MGRALTGNMPVDASQEDFNVFTTGLSKFVRRTSSSSRNNGHHLLHDHSDVYYMNTTNFNNHNPNPNSNPNNLSPPPPSGSDSDLLAPGTRLLRSGTSSGLLTVPDWKDGKGIGGGWDCLVNGDTSFLSAGAERGWLVSSFFFFFFFLLLLLLLLGLTWLLSFHI